MASRPRRTSPPRTHAKRSDRPDVANARDLTDAPESADAADAGALDPLDSADAAARSADVTPRSLPEGRIGRGCCEARAPRAEGPREAGRRRCHGRARC